MGLLVRLSLAFLVVSLAGAEAQTGRYGHGHSKYHHAYKGLMRPDAPTSSCCNDNDCGGLPTFYSSALEQSS